MTRRRVLLVRTDRIGDVILCTPAVQALATARPEWRLSMIVKGPIAQLLVGLPELERVLDVQGDSLLKLVRTLRAERFDAVLFFRFDLRVALACWLARVRIRLGPISSLGSRLFFNVGMRQRRSRVEKHEAEYNLDLLRMLGVEASALPAKVQVPAPDLEWGRRFLSEKGLTSYLAVHPGMGGSAENWPLSHYLSLVRALLDEGRTVVVTVGPQDREVASAFEAVKHPGLRVIKGLQLPQLGFVLAHADLVVAPSTGPLHLAAALGVPVAGFYPSAPRVETSRRWGPRGTHPRSTVLAPEDGRPLSSLTVEQSLEKIRGIYGQA